MIQGNRFKSNIFFKKEFHNNINTITIGFFITLKQYYTKKKFGSSIFLYIQRENFLFWMAKKNTIDLYSI